MGQATIGAVPNSGWISGLVVKLSNVGMDSVGCDHGAFSRHGLINVRISLPDSSLSCNWQLHQVVSQERCATVAEMSLRRLALDMGCSV